MSLKEEAKRRIEEADIKQRKIEEFEHEIESLLNEYAIENEQLKIQLASHQKGTYSNISTQTTFSSEDNNKFSQIVQLLERHSSNEKDPLKRLQ